MKVPAIISTVLVNKACALKDHTRSLQYNGAPRKNQDLRPKTSGKHFLNVVMYHQFLSFLQIFKLNFVWHGFLAF